MRIYLAGPITRGDQFANVATAIREATKLLEAGHQPFVPHLSCLWHMIAQVDYERWMEWDFAWIEVCEALVRLPGPSTGSDREVLFAIKRGIPVYFGVDEFLEHEKDKVK